MAGLIFLWQQPTESVPNYSGLFQRRPVAPRSAIVQVVYDPPRCIQAVAIAYAPASRACVQVSRQTRRIQARAIDTVPHYTAMTRTTATRITHVLARYNAEPALRRLRADDLALLSAMSAPRP